MPWRSPSATTATPREWPIYGRGLRLRIQNESGHDARRGGKPALAGGKPARTPLHFAQVGVRMYIHLHLAEFHVAEAHQREDLAHRVYALLHHVGRAHGLLQGAVPI